MQDSSNGGMATFIGLIIFAAFIAAIVAFFRGPAKRSEEYVKSLASNIADPNDAALLLSLYQQKGAKNVVLAWLLTAFFTPTIAYLYIGEMTKALLAFVTLQGFGVWWVVSWFSMPVEVLARNKKAADDALTQLRLMRPQLYAPSPPYQVPFIPVPAPEIIYAPVPAATVYAPQYDPAPIPQAYSSPVAFVDAPSAIKPATAPVSASSQPPLPEKCVPCGTTIFPDSVFCDTCGVRLP